MVRKSNDSIVCSWWLRFALLIPLRKALNNPLRSLNQWVKPGMVIADIGCGTGFIALPLARLVGENGKVIAVDLQPRMLDTTRLAARQAGLEDRILFQQALPETLGSLPLLDGAVTAWMVHEVPDSDRLLREIYSALVPNGYYLIIEPVFHVSEKKFKDECTLIEILGFTEEIRPSIALSRSVLYRKN